MLKTIFALATPLLLAGILLERGLVSIHQEYDKLLIYKLEIAQQKKEALALKLHLEGQIMSQSDPNWIILTLIRELGVVPEGQTKVYFKSS